MLAGSGQKIVYTVTLTTEKIPRYHFHSFKKTSPRRHFDSCQKNLRAVTLKADFFSHTVILTTAKKNYALSL